MGWKTHAISVRAKFEHQELGDKRGHRFIAIKLVAAVPWSMRIRKMAR